ncbi:MAG: primosomal protein N' [Chitinophagales bacterium]
MLGQVTYVDVLLPLALPQAYTYAVPFDLVEFVRVGQRVIVQFGKQKFYTAIVQRIHHQKPAVEPKLIESLADEEAIVTSHQLAFWKWMAAYYMCTEGEVLNAALPAGLKLSSETQIVWNDGYEGDYEGLSDDEFMIVQALRAQRQITVPQVQDLLHKRNVYPLLKTLFNLGMAYSAEELITRYKPRLETFVRLNDTYRNEANMEALFDELQRAKKQVELLLAFIQLGKNARFIKKSELLKISGADASVLKRLVEKGVFTEYKAEVSRLGVIQGEEIETPPLSEEQQQAITAISNLHESGKVVLLHGVTASGKTQVYMELMAKAIASGKQVLYMLPEIALTAQIINRLRKHFGDNIGIYHSKFNQYERVEIWNKVRAGAYKLVVAARSGVFLPYADLGLIIIDEEHDASYKQYDPAPRYHARDSAIVLASQFGARVILGSATPSLESFYNAEKGKYGLVTMTRRYGEVLLPEFLVEDVKRERKKMAMHGVFTETLTIHIREALQKKEQAILFINRRGFSQYQQCRTCGYTYKCKRCDVSLTYHKFQDRLLCHYCGYQEKTAPACKSCGTIDLDIVGSGTEKIEEEIAQLFPEARVGRLDLDTTRSKDGHQQVIASFENREIDILVGTQMVTKGLDFDHVSLVGIINADQALFFPGFRAHERAFQLMTQVGGRAGRRNTRGTVVVQTANPEHAVIRQVIQHDFDSFYKTEMNERHRFAYPPFTRMIQITLKHREVQQVEKAALYLANHLKGLKLFEVLGPSKPMISKLNNIYLRELLLKTNGGAGLPEIKIKIQQFIDQLRAERELRSVVVAVNVDP